MGRKRGFDQEFSDALGSVGYETEDRQRFGVEAPNMSVGWQESISRSLKG